MIFFVSFYTLTTCFTKVAALARASRPYSLNFEEQATASTAVLFSSDFFSCPLIFCLNINKHNENLFDQFDL